MTSGIVYQLSGLFSAELCVVSLASLRQVYDGPITLFVTKQCYKIARKIKQDQRLNVQLAKLQLPPELMAIPNPDWYNPHWTAKTFTYMLSPYDYTIYLDSDTVVLEDPSPMLGDFKVANCFGLRLLDDHRFSRSVRRRIYRMRGLSPVLRRMVNQCIERNDYRVNLGVLAYSKDHPAIREIHHLCAGFHYFGMYDEIAAHLVMDRHQVEYVDSTWNCIVQYDQQWDNRKIAHYTGNGYRKSLRGRRTWREHLKYALDNDFAQLRKWCGRYNEKVKYLLDNTPGYNQ